MELNTNLDHKNMLPKNTIRSFSGNQRLWLTLLLLVYLGSVFVLSPVQAARTQTLPLQFTSTTPETLTTSLQVTVPAGATASTLTVSCFDCDHTDWGSLLINGGARIALWPGPGPSNASGTIRISVPVSAWRTGSNTLAVTHSYYVAGRVDALSVSFTTSTPPSTPTTPAPNTPPSTPSISPLGTPLPLQFTSTTPETLTTSLQVTVPVGAIASTLSVSCFDCDHTDWGSLSINGGAAIALWPGPGPSNASGTIRISVPVSAWRSGSNTLAFTHSYYVAGRVDALSVAFASTPPSTPVAAPSLSLITTRPLPLQFTSTTPETLTTSLQVTVPAGATASTLSVSCFDCDHTDWGSLSINGGAGIALWPGPGPSNASGTIQISVPASAWKTGSNTLAVTHSQYVAGRIDALSVSFTATSGSAILSWTLGSEPDLAGYKVYIGTSSGTYNYPGSPFTLGATNTYTMSNLPKGQTYFFALSAYNTSGKESGLSAEASKSIY